MAAVKKKKREKSSNPNIVLIIFVVFLFLVTIGLGQSLQFFLILESGTLICCFLLDDLRTRSRLAPGSQQIVPANRLGADEVMLQIGMNCTRSLRRFRAGRWWDRAVMLARGHRWVRLHCRSVAEWRAVLFECGFDSQVLSASEGTPFANALLCARPR